MVLCFHFLTFEMLKVKRKRNKAMRMHGIFWKLNYPFDGINIDHANPYPATALGTDSKVFLDGRLNLDSAIHYMNGLMNKDFRKSKFIGYSIHSDLGNNQMLYKSFGDPPKTEVSPVEFMGEPFNVEVSRSIGRTILEIDAFLNLEPGIYYLSEFGITIDVMVEFLFIQLPLSWEVDLMNKFTLGYMTFQNLKHFQQWLVQYIFDKETSKRL